MVTGGGADAVAVIDADARVPNAATGLGVGKVERADSGAVIAACRPNARAESGGRGRLGSMATAAAFAGVCEATGSWARSGTSSDSRPLSFPCPASSLSASSDEEESNRMGSDTEDAVELAPRPRPRPRPRPPSRGVPRLVSRPPPCPPLRPPRCSTLEAVALASFWRPSSLSSSLVEMSDAMGSALGRPCAGVLGALPTPRPRPRPRRPRPLS